MPVKFITGVERLNLPPPSIVNPPSSPTLHGYRLAGDGGGFFGYQEEDQVGDLFGFYHPADGDLAYRTAPLRPPGPGPLLWIGTGGAEG